MNKLVLLEIGVKKGHYNKNEKLKQQQQNNQQNNQQQLDNGEKKRPRILMILI